MSHLLTLLEEMKNQNKLISEHDNRTYAEIFKLLDIIDHLRLKWQTAENNVMGAGRLLTTYKNELEQICMENKELEGQLVESRSQVAALSATRNELKRERDAFAGQLEAIHDLLRDEFDVLPEGIRKKLPFSDDRTTQAVSREQPSSAALESFEYDRTEASSDGNPIEYHSRGEENRDRGTRLGRKRSLSMIEGRNGQNPRKRPMNDMQMERDQGKHLAPSYQQTGDRSPLNRSFLGSHNVRGQLLPPFGAAPANSVSKMAAFVPSFGKLSDCVPRDGLLVPSIIYDCVKEIDQRGLCEQDLYQLGISDTNIHQLMEQYFEHEKLSLGKIWNFHLLAGCVKNFFLVLSEPLIPLTVLNTFVKACDMPSEGADMVSVLMEMPQPNRETLAFLMIHFQRVAEYSDKNKMTKESLAKCLAPTILGSLSVMDARGAVALAGKYVTVMNSFFDFPMDYWNRYLVKNGRGHLMGNLAPNVSPMGFRTDANTHGMCDSGIGSTPKPN